MFRFFTHTLSGLFLVLLSITVQVTVTALFAFPFSQINIIFLLLVIMILFGWKHVALALSLLLHLILELFSASAFGCILVPGVVTTLVTVWLSETVFTNKSFIAALALGGIGLTLYRGLYLLAVLSTNSGPTFALKGYMTPIAAEILLTTLGIGAVSFGMTHLSRRPV